MTNEHEKPVPERAAERAARHAAARAVDIAKRDRALEVVRDAGLTVGDVAKRLAGVKRAGRDAARAVRDMRAEIRRRVRQCRKEGRLEEADCLLDALEIVRTARAVERDGAVELQVLVDGEPAALFSASASRPG